MATPPTEGFYAGLGASYNSIRFDQDLYGNGVTNTYTGGVLVAYGAAGGPANPFHLTQSTFAPEIQTGYFKSFANKEYFWGVKFIYQYLGITASDNKIDSFQTGQFTSVGVTDKFIGNFLIGSSQTTIDNEFALIATWSKAFFNNILYIGAGPALFTTRTKFYNVIGFADLNGVHTDVTGLPVNLSTTKLLWGGIIQLGINHFLNDKWFLDFNYNYSLTGRFTINTSSSFENSSISGGTTYINRGTDYITAAQRINTQTFSISINFLF